MSEDSEASQVAALDTVLFRFASSDDAKLPTAAARVLPRILPMLDRNSAKVRAKVMEILKHLNGRLKDVWESPSSSSSSLASSFVFSSWTSSSATRPPLPLPPRLPRRTMKRWWWRRRRRSWIPNHYPLMVA
mmetsp:Transcript_33717/g.81687  ORF Transcript_33717/g.81687 Transcript_33717/m.81687 type:complete len:132 (+) Transcript_33717:195-590(+)